MNKILVTGAMGQIGTELVQALRSKHGNAYVIAGGHATKPTDRFRNSGPFVYLNVLDREQLAKLVVEEDVNTIFHMASILSAVGELNPQLCYEVNMGGLYNVTELANAEGSRLKHRVFNVNAMSFSARDLAVSIRKVIPAFVCTYKPDYRQAIADTWPTSLDDSTARDEWDWKPAFDLDKMSEDMIEKLRKTISE